MSSLPEGLLYHQGGLFSLLIQFSSIWYSFALLLSFICMKTEDKNEEASGSLSSFTQSFVRARSVLHVSWKSDLEGLVENPEYRVLQSHKPHGCLRASPFFSKGLDVPLEKWMLAIWDPPHFEFSQFWVLPAGEESAQCFVPYVRSRPQPIQYGEWHLSDGCQDICQFCTWWRRWEWDLCKVLGLWHTYPALPEFAIHGCGCCQGARLQNNRHTAALALTGGWSFEGLRNTHLAVSPSL